MTQATKDPKDESQSPTLFLLNAHCGSDKTQYERLVRMCMAELISRQSSDSLAMHIASNTLDRELYGHADLGWTKSPDVEMRDAFFYHFEVAGAIAEKSEGMICLAQEVRRQLLTRAEYRAGFTTTGAKEWYDELKRRRLEGGAFCEAKYRLYTREGVLLTAANNVSAAFRITMTVNEYYVDGGPIATINLYKH